MPVLWPGHPGLGVLSVRRDLNIGITSWFSFRCRNGYLLTIYVYKVYGCSYKQTNNISQILGSHLLLSRTDCALHTSPSFVVNQQTQRSFVSTALAEVNLVGVCAVPGKLNMHYYPQFMFFPSREAEQHCHFKVFFFFILVLYFCFVTFSSLDIRIKRNRYKVSSLHIITATVPGKFDNNSNVNLRLIFVHRNNNVHRAWIKSREENVSSELQTFFSCHVPWLCYRCCCCLSFRLK